MLYCLDDGNALLEGPASARSSNDELATAILSVPGAVATGDSASESPTRAQINTTDQTAILPSDSIPRPASSAEYLVSQVKEHKKGVLLGLGVLVLVIAGVAFGVYKFAGKKDTVAPSFESMKITKPTDHGQDGGDGITPDGH